MKSFASPYARWAGIGPYYAMFPLTFVNRVIEEFTKPGESVLDPFAGRASTIFAATTNGRPAIGIEINPVGWVYGQAKLHPAGKNAIVKRLGEISLISKTISDEELSKLPEFFHHCFAPTPLRFLLAARQFLRWKENHIDRTLMALILVDLHGNLGRSFSNQMRQGRAMEPNYSIAWWESRNLSPPEFDPVEFMSKKILWRYAAGKPQTANSCLFLGDSQKLMKQVAEKNQQGFPKFSLLFTSPPYIGISDYHRDQWLRLWMLGGKPEYARQNDPLRRDFSSQELFLSMLQSVFTQASELMRQDGCVYVRTDARPVTFNVTLNVLQGAFPNWHIEVIDQPYVNQTQTALYGDKSAKPGEKDIILYGPNR